MLNHPHIVKLIKLLDDPERGCCYMVIEYVSGGELFDYIVSHGRLREKDARKFIRQVRSLLRLSPSLNSNISPHLIAYQFLVISTLTALLQTEEVHFLKFFCASRSSIRSFAIF